MSFSLPLIYNGIDQSNHTENYWMDYARDYEN